jgi:hypothetical protein
MLHNQCHFKPRRAIGSHFGRSLKNQSRFVKATYNVSKTPGIDRKDSLLWVTFG